MLLLLFVLFFSNRGERVSMGHSKEIGIGVINAFSHTGPKKGRNIGRIIIKNMEYIYINNIQVANVMTIGTRQNIPF